MGCAREQEFGPSETIILHVCVEMGRAVFGAGCRDGRYDHGQHAVMTLPR
jgi:hypothetical protein